MPGRTPSSAQRDTALSRTLRWALILAAAIGAPAGAEAAWDFFGDIRFTGGRADNPRLLDPNQPAELRRAQNQETLGLTLGARAKWEKTDFDFSYSPYGEFYEESDLSQVGHAFGLTWDHRYTPRLSMRLKEDFGYSPKLPTNPIDPNTPGLGGALIGETSTTSHDFRDTLTFRATEKSTISWWYRNLLRSYSNDQLLDVTGNAAGTEYARIFGPHVTLSGGYEFGLFKFRDGEPPNFPSSLVQFCESRDPNKPTDPNCIAFVAAANAIPAEDQGFDRHRLYGGYAYDVPAGLHADAAVGYDALVFDNADFGTTSRPFLRGAVGWNGARFHSRVGYEQGLDEGGGVATSAELRRLQADVRLQFTEKISFDVSALRDDRRAIDFEGNTSEVSLVTTRGAGTFTYKLEHGWALLALFSHDRQTTEGILSPPDDVKTTRYALGASWSFAR